MTLKMHAARAKRAIQLITVIAWASVAGACAATQASVHSAEGPNPPRRGHVVDADTEAGIAGALVVAVWSMDHVGLPGMVSSSTTCEAQTFAMTDGEGRFDLSGIAYAPPGISRASLGDSRKRLLIVFKPGYVRGNDLDILPRHDRELFSWQVYPPESNDSIPGIVDLKKIRLKKAELSSPDTWVYENAILRSAQCEDRLSNDRSTPEFQTFAQMLRAKLRASPCAMESLVQIPQHALASFGWALGESRFFYRVGEIEHTAPNELKGTTAGTMCRALNEEKHE